MPGNSYKFSYSALTEIIKYLFITGVLHFIVTVFPAQQFILPIKKILIGLAKVK